jgi:hypothetical protein
VVTDTFSISWKEKELEASAFLTVILAVIYLYL